MIKVRVESGFQKVTFMMVSEYMAAQLAVSILQSNPSMVVTLSEEPGSIVRVEDQDTDFHD